MKSQKKYKAIYIKLTLFAIVVSNFSCVQAQVDTAWIQQQAETSRKAYEEANRNKAQLIKDGKWNLNKMPGMVYLKNPIEEMPGMHDYGSYHIPFCVDHLSTTSDFGDFRSTVNATYTHSYDGSTGTLFEYAHSGYNYMLSNPARVVAAAGGIIVAKGDGNYDQNCSYTAGNGNYMIIEHSDGRRTGYYHLRNGLLTTKGIGASIDEGEPIGYPGGFHGTYLQLPICANLFFELRDASNNVMDPFGSVTPGGIWTWAYAPSSWRDSTNMESIVGSSELKYLKTMKHIPNSNDNCGEPIYSYCDHFNPGDPFYIRYAITNYDSYNDSVIVNVFNPVGFPILPTHIRPKICINCGSYIHLIDAIQYITYVLPTNPAFIIPGTYTVVLNIPDSWTGGYKTYYHYFTVGCQSNYSLSSTVSGVSGTIAGNDIHSYQTCNSGSRVKYVAGNEVILHPNFIAYQGSDVTIYTEPCVVPPRLEDENNNVGITDDSEMTVTPNPASDYIIANIPGAVSKTILKIYNSTMQLIKTFNFENEIENKISTVDLSPGIYFIDAQSESQSYKTKFVVNR